MINRIVIMQFEPSKVDEFLTVFDQSKEHIRAFPGNAGLKLIQDTNDSSIMSTYSLWETEADLEAYRHSELFKSTWAKTKILFRDKPVAFSNWVIRELI